MVIILVRLLMEQILSRFCPMKILMKLKTQLDKILLKSKTKVLDMCKTNAGTNIYPAPPLPPANPDDPQASLPVSP